MRCIAAPLSLLTLWAAHATAQPRAPPADVDWYVDSEGREQAFDRRFREQSSRHSPSHGLRAVAELIGLVGLGAAWYWVNIDRNREDWDFPTLEERFVTFEAHSFDDNRYVTNQLHHPISGTAYYLFSRVNDFGPFEALGFSFGATAFYELVVEIPERVSVNDLVTTPFASWAPGEFFFQLGDYLNSAPGGGGFGNRVAAATLGLPRYLHRNWDDAPPPPPMPPDALGFSSAYWHRFGMRLGVAGVENEAQSSGLVTDAIVEAELARMPGFLRPGRFDAAFADGNFVEMRSRASFDQTGLVDVDLWFCADIAGYYQQDFERVPGGTRGAAWSGALNAAGRYTSRSLLGRQDAFAVAHLFGQRVRGWWRAGELSARASALAHLDFAGVRALAYQDWISRYGVDGTKSVLRKHSYYYALGASAAGSAAIAHRRTELGASAGYGRYQSIEGFDRNESELRDVHNADTVIELGAWLGHAATDAPVEVRLAAEQTHRESFMPPLLERRWDRRISISLGAHF